jgi:hypothetical protein
MDTTWKNNEKDKLFDNKPFIVVHSEINECSCFAARRPLLREAIVEHPPAVLAEVVDLVARVAGLPGSLLGLGLSAAAATR